jgi:hypothetical protein
VDSSSRPEEWEEVGCQYSYVALHWVNTSIIVTGIIDTHLFINCIDIVCTQFICQFFLYLPIVIRKAVFSFAGL